MARSASSETPTAEVISKGYTKKGNTCEPRRLVVVVVVAVVVVIVVVVVLTRMLKTNLWR